jgi:hypothetical protein
MKLPKKKMTTKFSSRPAENARSRKSSRSSSGCPPRAVSRRSQARVSASAGMAAAMEIQVHAGQPSSRPRVSGTSASARLAEIATAPTGSSRGRRCPRADGTTNLAITTAMMPTGTFTRKIARQLRPATLDWISPPPRIWPDTKPKPIVAPYQASARLRSRGGKAAVMRATTCGTMIAPVSPCTRRAATSSPGDWDTPHTSEATTKLTTPIRNSRR